MTPPEIKDELRHEGSFPFALSHAMRDIPARGPRLFVESPLIEGAAVAASPEQANYLLNVMRLDEGGGVLLFNGRDGEWRATLSRPSNKRLDLVPQEQTRAQTPMPDLHYLFAPLKSARLDYMIQKATEMGAGVLQPVMTQHVQAPRLKTERLRANAIEAAEQCGILSVPECREMVKLSEAIAALGPDRHLVFCDEREDASSPIEWLRREAKGPLALVIGPEGGFSQAERQFLKGSARVTTISLGPRILRADTAAVAALAVVQASVGDWGDDGGGGRSGSG